MPFLLLNKKKSTFGDSFHVVGASIARLGGEATFALVHKTIFIENISRIC